MFPKPWNPLFDARKEKIDSMLVWVRLLGLPLEYWFCEVFMMIGNSIGQFVEVDMTFTETRLMVVVHVFMNLDLKEDLVEYMEL